MEANNGGSKNSQLLMSVDPTVIWTSIEQSWTVVDSWMSLLTNNCHILPTMQGHIGKIMKKQAEYGDSMTTANKRSPGFTD